MNPTQERGWNKSSSSIYNNFKRLMVTFDASIDLEKDLERLAKMMVLLSLTGILLLLSVLGGSSRRRSKGIALKACLWASYTMSSYLIAYTLGLMQNFWSEGFQAFFPVWGVLLLLAFGNADSFSAYSLDDNEQWRRYNIQFLLKFGTLMFYLSSHTSWFHDRHYATPIMLLFLSAALKGFTKNQSLAAITRFSLQKSNALVAYTEDGTRETGKQKSLEVMEHVALVDVWTCKGELLSQRSHGQSLKDICMSFSFYKLLRLRYSGHTSSQEARRKTWPLIQELLLSGESDGHERVFTVIEEELAFLYDLLYTKYAVIFRPKRLYLRLVEFLLTAVASIYLFALLIYVSGLPIRELGFWYSLDLWATMGALVIYFIAETMQVILLAFTRQAKVNCVCGYVKRHRQSQRNSNLTDKCIEFVCRLPSRKPWERKLHQYSLLEYFTYRPSNLLSNPFVYQFADWYRDGQKEGTPVTLSGEVKKAVVDCLKNLTGSQLENGQASLRRHNVSSELLSTCKLTTQTQVIMVWHVVTTLCEYKFGKPDTEEERTKSFGVATSLSKYLAYLVAFVPRLLPDHHAITVSFFAETVKQARHQLSGCHTLQKRIEKLYQTADGDSCLSRGARLAKRLLEEISDRGLLWEILADFWVEMTLFVAPLDDVRAHAEKLADGGEFLTHVWALLFHAGIERSPLVEPPLELA